MADNTKIEWADATLNYINGCSVLSPGCANCYAMRLAGTRLKHHPSRAGLTQPGKAGPVWNGIVRDHEPALLQALRWKAPRRIFWNAHGDTFHDAVPDEWIDRLFAVCALTPQHTHLILTKRPARMRRYCTELAKGGRHVDSEIWRIVAPLPGGGYDTALCKNDQARAVVKGMGGSPGHPTWFLPNVWLGVSIEDQARADDRIPDLLATPAAVRFISAEPLLGPLDLNELGVRRECRHEDADVEWDTNALNCRECEEEPLLDWVIVGGESGPGARPMHPDWARSLRDQCQDAGAAFHFKQWGEYSPLRGDLIPTPRERQAWVHVDGGKVVRAKVEADLDALEREEDRAGRPLYSQMLHVGKKAAGRLLDGVEHNEYPS